MTDRFEVHERDGAARIGELRLAESHRTPALAGDLLVDAGSLWARDRERPAGDPSALTVLPHRAFPPGTPGSVREAFAPEYPDVEFPSAAVVSSDTAADYGADAYVLSGGPALADHARSFVDSVVETRRAIPDDTALVVAGAAAPANVAALAYAGVDLVDADYAHVRGTEGFYLTPDGERFLEDLTELPCGCRVCANADAGSDDGGPLDRAACAEHNVAALRTELVRVRERIREGRLRDYLAGQARHTAWTTAVLRLLDEEYAYLEERTPVVRRGELLAATDDALRRVEIQRFADRVTSRYRCRFDAPLVLLPCSARKPYSESQSHAQFTRAIDYRGHVASMTSPIGVVPSELELTYPAQHYDSVVTGRWSATETEFVASVLERYLGRNDDAYPELIAHLPEEYLPIVDRVEEALGVRFERTVVDHPTTDASLAALSEALDGYDQYRMRRREHNTVRAIADYQFGADAGAALFGEIATPGRYPKLRVERADDREQLAALVPEYGTLALTLAGARRWVESSIPTKRVEIDGFVPHGSVLAPGVLAADASIRPGDEVVVEGPAAFAVGRAAAHGRAMADGERGVAVQVRHCEELA